MDWNLAIARNTEALRRIVAMLVAMVAVSGSSGGQFTFFPPEGSDASKEALAEKSKLSPTLTLPRHLHRLILRLLRPTESATRRLIIIAARGLVVKIRPWRPRKPTAKKPPLNRKNGYGTGIVIRPGSLPEWAKALLPKRSPRLSLPLLDPLPRFGVRRRYPKPATMPRVRLLGGAPLVPLFQPQREPEPPPAPSADDPLDATRIHRRLEAIGRALDDLPGQAQRLARWEARRDARLARERGEGDHAGQLHLPPTPTPQPSPPSLSPPHKWEGDALAAPGPTHRNGAGDGATASTSPLSGWLGVRANANPTAMPGEEVKATALTGETLEGLGITPEAFALCRGKRRSAPSNTAPTRRFHRFSPMRPGRPPGFRKRPAHEVHLVLNELHGLAVYARDGP